MAEEKKIENAVYEYDVLEERTERRCNLMYPSTFFAIGKLPP